MPRYVIIGGSAGGIGAVEAIREVDPIGTIAMISEEPFPQYSRPMIADYLSGEASFEKMKYRDDDFWERNHVEALTGRRVVELNLAEKYVVLHGGNRINFEKLLIATGAKPFIPEIDGVKRDGVFTFTTLSDAEGIAARVKKVNRAVVIGGGRIGVCVAEALVKLRVKVTMIQRSRILSRVLDATASTIVEKICRMAGINVIAGHTVKRVLGRCDDDKVVGGVVLDNNEEIPCDLVVIAMGVAPRVELVTGTEVKVNEGIIVDEFMRTNVPDVFACGDVAEVYDFVWGENRLLPQWPTAYLGGRVAGYNMAGKRVEYPGGTVMSTLKHFNLPIISAGITNPTENDGYEMLANHDLARNFYKKIVLKNDVIMGMTFIGDIEKAGIIFHLMKNKVNVGNFKRTLLSENFGLISLSEPLREKMLLGELA